MNNQGTQKPMSLKQAMQNISPEAMTVLEGKVVSISPLKIQATNDDKLIISKNIMCLPRHLTNYQTTVDISLGKGAVNSLTDGGQKLSTFSITGASMTVHNGLKLGDTVYMLSFNHGKKYYVFDREE